MNSQILQLIFIGAAVFGLLFSIAKHPVGHWVVVILAVASLGTALVVYLLRCMPATAERLYALPGAHQFINFACALTGEQPPKRGASKAQASDGAEGKTTEAKPSDDGISLKRPDDFRDAIKSMQSLVLGHDAAIVGMITHLERSVALRRRRERKQGAPPLGVFVVVGVEGIGRRHLATQVAAHLFARPAVTCLRGSDYPDVHTATAALFGTVTQAGSMLAGIRSQPQHIIFIENFEMLPPRVLMQLRDALRAGSASDEAGRPVSFEDTIVVLSTSKALEMLEATERRGQVGDARTRGMVEAMSQGTHVPAEFFSVVTDFYLLHPPSPNDRARVLLHIMKKICAEYDVTLDYVEPAILAAEVAALPARPVFESAPERLRHKLTPELAELAKKGRRRLVISAQKEGQ